MCIMSAYGRGCYFCSILQQETTKTVLYVFKLRLIAWCLHFSAENSTSTTLQITTTDIFSKGMHCYVVSFVICISNKVQYLEKENSLRNSTKEVTFVVGQNFKLFLVKISFHGHLNEKWQISFLELHAATV